jgi:hypothetical protein
VTRDAVFGNVGSIIARLSDSETASVDVTDATWQHERS